ncbi:MAG: DNA polymerase III subunit gamma/tau [Sandaracinus sp.]
MSYTVLARKYRPQTFADLSGQEHVTRTLGNAIASGRVAHAFLFTGVRGVGKTTTARILAKALNCVQGPTIAPCGVCDPCKEITVGSDLDVLEIDGASNNSVDDVRRLQETIPFRPTRDRFKVVIVDEVHMLSTGAFNAFLKTLEEPPPHVKFIFATTESQKVPITIRSRCQRYDFRLIPQSVVSERVRHILAAEGIEADDHAIQIVAREAAGSMRDALTLLDQIVAFSGGKLVGSEVATVLGIADRAALHDATEALLRGDGAAVLAAVDLLATRGLDLLHFARSVVELLRDLVVLRTSGEHTELVSLVDEERARAVALAKEVEPLEVQRAFHAASQLVDDMAKATLPRTVLEMGLVRIATRPPLRALADIVARLDALERRGPGPSGGGGRAGGPPTGGGSSGPPRRGPAGASAAPVTGGTLSELPVARMASDRTPAVTARREEPSAPVEPRASVTPLAAAAAVAIAPVPMAAPAVEPPPVERPARASAPPPSVSSVGTVAAPRMPPITQSPGDAMALWEPIVAALGGTRPALGAVLAHAVPKAVTPERVVLALARGSFYAKQADTEAAKSAIADITERRLGGRPLVEVIEVDVAVQAAEPTLAKIEDERARAKLEATRRKALNHPMVVEALAVFDAKDRTVEVRVDEG